MIKQIGTKIYYCLMTGNVIKIIGDMQGCVRETTFDEDIEIYTELKERDKETIGILQFEYGEYFKLSQNSTGVMVDTKTKELIFTYEELPIEPVEPSDIDILKEEQKQQNEEILINMMANTEMFEMILGMMPIQVNTSAKTKNPMIDVYVTLYTKGLKEIDDVPLAIREQFVERLNELNISIR